MVNFNIPLRILLIINAIYLIKNRYFRKNKIVMNIAIIGYGRMGHEIEAAAIKRGHIIKLIIDQHNSDDLNKANLDGIDIAIEFSTPSSAVSNITKCFENGVSVVSGTTGWLEHYQDVVSLCKKSNNSFIHSSNFSIGVNLLFRLNSELAKHMNKYADYKVSIEEIHHTKKLDAPSGTAITLSQGIELMHPRYQGWCSVEDQSEGMIPIRSLREGNVPGIHTVKWDSDIDIIILRHEARNRKGLALGAMVAAEYIHDKVGNFTMTEVLGL